MPDNELSLEPASELASELETSFGPHLAVVCARTAPALETCGYAGLLVHSGSLLTVFEDDRTYPFEVHAPFKVWTPLSDVPDCFVYFEPGSRPQLIFHRPTDYWYKSAALPHAYWTRHFDIKAAADLDAARALLPKDLTRVAYIGDAFPALPVWNVGAVNPPKLIRHLDYGRATKTPYELACMREASRLGVRGHVAAAQAFAEGASEFEIEIEFLKACGLREQELPYNPIIALNEGGAVLHYQLLEKQAPAERHSLLIDAGAEFGGYASDITRTHALRAGDFAALIERMDEMQQTLCAGLKAGVDWRDVQLRAHSLTGKLLRDADITNCSADEAVATGEQTLCAGLKAGVDWRDVQLRAHSLTGKLLRDADITNCSADEAVATGVTNVFLHTASVTSSDSRCMTRAASSTRPKAATSRGPKAIPFCGSRESCRRASSSPWSPGSISSTSCSTPRAPTRAAARSTGRESQACANSAASASKTT